MGELEEMHERPADDESALDHRAREGGVHGTEQGEIPSLHGLRGVAILMVIVSHSSETIHLGHTGRSLFDLVPTGAFGVNVFFVLSGFLITRVVLGYSTKKDRSLKTFYKRRALRLIPALYTFVFIVMILGAVGVFSIPALAALSALLFIWDYSPWTVGVWWLGHTWSLSIEEQFYILWAPLLALAGRRRALKVAVALIVLVPIARVFVYFAFPTPYLRLRGDSMLHTRADVLMVGCLIGLLWDSERFQRFLQRILLRWLLVAAVAYTFVSSFLINHEHGKWSQTVGNSADAFAIAFIMVYAVVYSSGWLGRALNSRWMVQVGLMSYSLYLYQELFLTPLNKSITGAFPLNIVCTFAAGVASYYLIEIPFLNLRRRIV
ncbi:MAG: acyltransferase [Acidimicrobiia bacterium]|nr:acyltransferase [Acidimicrobiia bacterium]